MSDDIPVANISIIQDGWNTKKKPWSSSVATIILFSTLSFELFIGFFLVKMETRRDLACKASIESHKDLIIETCK